MGWARRALAVAVVYLAFLPFTGLPAKAVPIEPSDWSPRARLILAQSCVGEAGFESGPDGECAAIAWVYAKRVAQMRRAGRRISYLSMVRQYSQPIRLRRRLWVVSLRPDLARPRGWPSSWPRWEDGHQDQWSAVLDAVDAWRRGEVEDPCPAATHFGAHSDSPSPRLVRAECSIPTRNIFYRLR